MLRRPPSHVSACASTASASIGAIAIDDQSSASPALVGSSTGPPPSAAARVRAAASPPAPCSRSARWSRRRTRTKIPITPKIRPRASFGFDSPSPIVSPITAAKAATTKTPIRPKREERLKSPENTGGSLSTPPGRLPPMLDERWIRSLHVESMRRADLHREREPHVLFQASTIGALLDGAFEGDLSFAELGEHGDLGLGTLNHLDGEMIAIDGEFFRADVDGRLSRIAPEERTPFAVITDFETEVDKVLEGSVLGHEEL